MIGRRGLVRAGWVWVAASVALLLVFGALRLRSLGVGVEPGDDFGVRYLARPHLAWLHIAPGLAYLMLAPLQFVAAVRSRRPSVHRGLGRALAGLAVVSGLTAIAAAIVLPAYGGTGTTWATLAFGTAFVGFLVRGVRHARRRRFDLHRECMIRAYAIGLGVATIRLVIVVAEALTGAAMREVFAASFWIGLSINAIVAESWIRATRRR